MTKLVLFCRFEQYYSLFFGLVAEECKAAQFRTGHLIRPSNWKRIKVVDVVAQSQDEYTGCVGNKFPQFSSIDSVVGIPSTMLSRNTSICSVCVELMGNNALEDVPVAGDLVVIYHAHWERFVFLNKYLSVHAAALHFCLLGLG